MTIRPRYILAAILAGALLAALIAWLASFGPIATGGF
jgi:hypothetical protein